MKTILLPEPLLKFFKIDSTKSLWPKVLCRVSYERRFPSGRISYEFYEFYFKDQHFAVDRTYNSQGRCLSENVTRIEVIE